MQLVVYSVISIAVHSRFPYVSCVLLCSSHRQMHYLLTTWHHYHTLSSSGLWGWPNPPSPVHDRAIEICCSCLFITQTMVPGSPLLASPLMHASLVNATMHFSPSLLWNHNYWLQYLYTQTAQQYAASNSALCTEWPHKPIQLLITFSMYKVCYTVHYTYIRSCMSSVPSVCTDNAEHLPSQRIQLLMHDYQAHSMCFCLQPDMQINAHSADRALEPSQSYLWSLG